MGVLKTFAVSLAAILSTSVPALAQAQVTVWVAGEPGETTVYETLAQQYNAEHPDSVISVVKNSSDLFNPALVPALSAGEGPDLFTFGTGPGQPAALIKGGLVADLTPAYSQLGWGKYVPEDVENVTSSDGKLWAVGNEVESTGMYYNKALFTKAGVDVPKTWAEFESAVEKLKAAGFETPIGLGGADKWPISHIQSMMFGRYAGPEGLDKVMFGDGRWDDQPFVAASRKLQEMAKKGFFGPSPLASGSAEILDSFWAGQIPMVYTGSFVIPNGLVAAGDRIGDYGVFAMPPFEEGQKIYPTESIGSGWYIRAGSKVQDVAIDFLNYTFFSDPGRLALLNAGTTPIGPLDAILKKANIPTLAQEVSAVNEQYRQNGSIPAYLDTVMPANVTTTTYDGLQALLLDSMTPEQFVDSIEQEWEAAKSKGEILLPGGIAEK